MKLASFWEQVQLTTIRWLALLLGAMDRLFNSHWGERLLERLAQRWQAQITRLDAALARLEQERSQLQLQVQALALHAAAVYLGGRQLARNELRFDPGDPHDEEVLDAAINLLVKEQLASLEMREIEKGHYLYYLEPDWQAIHDRLVEASSGQPETELTGWLNETIRFIHEAFLSADS